MLVGECGSVERKPCPFPTLFSSNPTLTDLESGFVLHGERPAATFLSYGILSCCPHISCFFSSVSVVFSQSPLYKHRSSY